MRLKKQKPPKQRQTTAVAVFNDSREVISWEEEETETSAGHIVCAVDKADIALIKVRVVWRSLDRPGSERYFEISSGLKPNLHHLISCKHIAQTHTK